MLALLKFDFQDVYACLRKSSLIFFIVVVVFRNSSTRLLPNNICKIHSFLKAKLHEANISQGMLLNIIRLVVIVTVALTFYILIKLLRKPTGFSMRLFQSNG